MEEGERRTEEGGRRMEDGGWRKDSDIRTMVALSLFRPESTEGIGRIERAYKEGIQRV